MKIIVIHNTSTAAVQHFTNKEVLHNMSVEDFPNSGEKVHYVFKNCQDKGDMNVDSKNVVRYKNIPLFDTDKWL